MTTLPECGFCNIINSDEQLILKTGHWIVKVSFSQVYLGRCLVILHRHVGDLAELHNEEWLDFAHITKELEAAARKAFGAEMFNWSCLMNDAYKLKHPQPHVHWHMRPRYSKPVDFASMTFRDTQFGHHYDRAEPDKASTQLQDMIADKLRAELTL